jgi:hypothetical protein
MGVLLLLKRINATINKRFLEILSIQIISPSTSSI